ncbi:TPA: hypothetical protein QDB51_002639 [Burkholderia vietnamiensis]|nr:hypothetical protein [Burkholderia vietnamiensis]
MSTNASIAILKKDGTIDLAYCHHNGYLIDGVGETLLNHYKDSESIKDLISGGAIDSLGVTKESTEFYGRDDNCTSFKNIESYHEAYKEEYNYLFDEKTNSWEFSKGYGDKSFNPLTQQAINGAREQVVYNFIKERDSHPRDVKLRKDIIEEHLVKGADFENVKNLFKPYDLSKQVSPHGQEKFDYAQEVAKKIALKNKLQDDFNNTMNQLGQLSKQQSKARKI